MSNGSRLIRNSLAVAALALALTAGTALSAGPGPVVQVQAKGSVDDTVTQLKKMVAGNGMMVMGELH